MFKVTNSGLGINQGIPLDRIKEKRYILQKQLEDFMLFQQNSINEKILPIKVDRTPGELQKSTITKSRIMAELHQANKLQAQIESCSDIAEINVNPQGSYQVQENNIKQQYEQNYQYNVQNPNKVQQKRVNYTKDFNNKENTLINEVRNGQIDILKTSIQKRDEAISKSLSRIEKAANQITKSQPANQQTKKHDMNIAELQTVSSSDSDVENIVQKSLLKQMQTQHKQNNKIQKTNKSQQSQEIQTSRPSYSQQLKIINSPIKKLQGLLPVEPYETSRSKLSQESQSYLRWARGE